MVFGFGKKKEQQGQAAPGLPIDQVTALKQRGMSNDQIIPEMEKQGYNSSQIFDALNQVSLSNPPSEQPPDMAQPDALPPQDFPQQQPLPEHPPLQPQIDKDKIEEIAEAIIDEKWKEFEEDVKVIIDWKEKTEAKINQFEQQIKDLTSSLNTLHKSVMGKITDYDKNITDVGVEIKAMEKVFQKVLPSLTENVNKLDRMTKSSKLKK
jgi:hypothetical protein|tara:strand:+ start:5976 stop:6599 length:624 start_codon:yes stop_codon:yes gene_type:complete